jgi:hypothetical protein
MAQSPEHSPIQGVDQEAGYSPLGSAEEIAIILAEIEEERQKLLGSPKRSAEETQHHDAIHEAYDRIGGVLNLWPDDNTKADIYQAGGNL